MFEDRWIYWPLRYPTGRWSADEHPFRVHDETFEAADGVRLQGWLIEPASTNGNQLCILHLHGSAGNVTYRSAVLDRLRKLPATVFAIDYRGYGRSQGKPTEAGLLLDAEAAHDHLVRLGFAPDRIVPYGESLGVAIAAQLAHRRECAALILQSGLTDGWDMAQRKMPWLPRWLLRATTSNQFDARTACASCTKPKLFLAGDRDRMVSPAMTRALFEAAAEPKQLVMLPGFGHDNFEALDHRFDDAIRRFVSHWVRATRDGGDGS